jgi:hypothetical protein
MKRDSIKRDLLTPKYRQRKLPRRRKGGRHDRQDQGTLEEG